MNHPSIETGRVEVPPEEGPTFETAARGTVRVAPAVLIELIELTARDVAGVTGFQSRHRMERILPGTPESSPSPEEGRDMEARGVRVHLVGNHIDADISVTVDEDASMGAVSHAIRRQVGIAVTRMLGLEVRLVNVYIAGIRPRSGE